MLAAVSLLYCSSAMAATIYKSVDANGVVSYSDTKPENEVLVETIEIAVQEPASGELTQQRLQDMRETTDRMAADRMARERHRVEMRQIEAQTAAREAEQDMPDYSDSPVTYGGYYPYPVQQPWLRPPHYRPNYPIIRPPLLPPHHNRPASTRPLPSNDYPASLIRRHYDPKVRASLDRR